MRSRHEHYYQSLPNWENLQKFPELKKLWLRLSEANDVPDRIEDRKVNLEHCFRVDNPEGSPPGDSQASCDACLRYLPPNGPTQDLITTDWFRCKVCSGYDECTSCHTVKRNVGKPHPHPMFQYTYDKSAHRDNSIEERILSFDGGGIRGYMTILMFQKFVTELKQQVESQDTLDNFVASFVLPRFSVLSGTSIGGLIAVALSIGVKLSAIIDAFENRADEIFESAHPYIPSAIEPLLCPLYKRSGFIHIYRDLVRSVPKFKNLRDREVDILCFREITETPWDCLVTSFDMYTREPMIFSKRDHPNMCILDALLATSAAPVYFPVHFFSRPREEAPSNDQCIICENGSKLEPDEVCESCRFKSVKGVSRRLYACVDGGLWANDPQFVALLYVKLHKNLPNFMNTVSLVFSFGTGENCESLSERIKQFNEDPGLMSLINPNSDCSIVNALFTGSQKFAEKSVGYLQRTNSVWSVKLQIKLDHPIRLDQAKKEDLDHQKLVVQAFFATKPGLSQMRWAVRRFFAIPIGSVRPEANDERPIETETPTSTLKRKAGETASSNDESNPKKMKPNPSNDD